LRRAEQLEPVQQHVRVDRPREHRVGPVELAAQLRPVDLVGVELLRHVQREELHALQRCARARTQIVSAHARTERAATRRYRRRRARPRWQH
jgi:hypothetical protein